MATIREPINRSIYLCAYALFFLANEMIKRVRSIEKELCSQLGINDTHPIIDAIYNVDNGGSEAEFKEVLAQHGIIIDWLNDDTPRKSKKNEQEAKS